MNVLTIAGNVGRDSELRQVNTSSGQQSVLSFAVAVKSSKKDAEGKYISVWFDCSLWGKRADTLVQYIKKGSSVTVTGEVELEQYTNSQGVAGAKMKINVQNVTLQGGGQQQSSNGQGQAQQQQRPQHVQQSQQSSNHPARQAPPQGYQPQIGTNPMQQAMHNPAGPIDFDDDIPF